MEDADRRYSIHSKTFTLPNLFKKRLRQEKFSRQQKKGGCPAMIGRATAR
jgi:hypothetical protein